MPVYRVVLSNQAESVIRRMALRERPLYERVACALDDLGRDPFQGKPLKGRLQGRYSYRVGSHRILYWIRKTELLVAVVDVGHRREIYRV